MQIRCTGCGQRFTALPVQQEHCPVCGSALMDEPLAEPDEVDEDEITEDAWSPDMHPLADFNFAVLVMTAVLYVTVVATKGFIFFSGAEAAAIALMMGFAWFALVRGWRWWIASRSNRWVVFPLTVLTFPHRGIVSMLESIGPENTSPLRWPPTAALFAFSPIFLYVDEMYHPERDLAALVRSGFDDPRFKEELQLRIWKWTLAVGSGQPVPPATRKGKKQDPLGKDLVLEFLEVTDSRATATLKDKRSRTNIVLKGLRQGNHFVMRPVKKSSTSDRPALLEGVIDFYFLENGSLQAQLSDGSTLQAQPLRQTTPDEEVATLDIAPGRRSVSVALQSDRASDTQLGVLYQTSEGLFIVTPVVAFARDIFDARVTGTGTPVSLAEVLEDDWRMPSWDGGGGSHLLVFPTNGLVEGVMTLQSADPGTTAVLQMPAGDFIGGIARSGDVMAVQFNRDLEADSLLGRPLLTAEGQVLALVVAARNTEAGLTEVLGASMRNVDTLVDLDPPRLSLGQPTVE